VQHAVAVEWEEGQQLEKEEKTQQHNAEGEEKK
jgi:hypothetical protein